MKMYFTGGNLCGTDETGYPPPEEVLDNPHVLFTYYNIFDFQKSIFKRMSRYYKFLNKKNNHAKNKSTKFTK